jgi:nickel transport protein
MRFCARFFSRIRAVSIVVFFGAALLFPMALFGHGVEVSEKTGGDRDAVRVIRFGYTTGEAMSYARVFVYPPSSPTGEILQGTTDRNGVFCFLPDERGEWRLVAEDGMGHRGEIRIIRR